MKKIITIILSIIMISCIGVINPPKAGAISYKDTYKRILNGGIIYTQNGNYNITANYNDSISGYWQQNDTSPITVMDLTFSSSIPKNSLISVIISTVKNVNGTDYYPFYNWTSKTNGVSLVNSSVGERGYNYLTFYTDRDITNIISIGSGNDEPIGAGIFGIDISALSITELNEEPTKAQIQQIGISLNNIYSTISGMISDTSNVSDKIDQIAVDTATQTEIEQDREDREEEDRTNLEDRTTTTDGDANTAGGDASQTGQTLFQAFGQFISALTNISGTSCRLPDINVHSFNFRNLDLCQFTIPPSIMGLASIGMVFIIVPLGINLVKKMLNLYKEIVG